MTKVDADELAAEAATQAGHANAGYLTAMAVNDDIQTTGSQIAENNRLNAITAARKYGGAAAESCRCSRPTNARSRCQRGEESADDEATAEYMRAVSARTNADGYGVGDNYVPGAKEYADAAGVAYAAANSAAGRLRHAAYIVARDAVDGVMDDSSLEDANTARDTAEAQEGIAADELIAAMTQQTAAEGAEMKAMMYADSSCRRAAAHGQCGRRDGGRPTQPIRRLKNSFSLGSTGSPTCQAVNTAVKAANDATADHGGADSHGHMAAFGDLGECYVRRRPRMKTPNVPASRMISVDPGGEGGDPVALRHAGPGADEADDTVDDLTDNFVQGPGLGDFVHEKYISGLDITVR